MSLLCSGKKYLFCAREKIPVFLKKKFFVGLTKNLSFRKV